MQEVVRQEIIDRIQQKIEQPLPCQRQWLVVPLMVLAADLNHLSNESLLALEIMLDDERMQYRYLTECK